MTRTIYLASVKIEITPEESAIRPIAVSFFKEKAVAEAEKKVAEFGGEAFFQEIEFLE